MEMKIIRNDLNTNTFLTAEHGRLSGEDIYIFKTGGVDRGSQMRCELAHEIANRLIAGTLEIQNKELWPKKKVIAVAVFELVSLLTLDIYGDIFIKELLSNITDPYTKETISDYWEKRKEHKW
jgi:hypothetical protein